MRRFDSVLELRAGESRPRRSEVRMRRSLPGELLVAVEEGRKREVPFGMRPPERDWDWV